jgi:uncharacterized membrane protein YhaH (DUF805 family)
MQKLAWWFNFEGRITRLSFWLSVVGFWLSLFVSVLIISVLFGRLPDANRLAKAEEVSLAGQILVAVTWLAIGWSSLCLQVKRWHDRGKSGWWVWIALVPVIGGFWQLIECGFKRGTVGSNAYGPEPRSSSLQ